MKVINNREFKNIFFFASCLLFPIVEILIHPGVREHGGGHFLTQMTASGSPTFPSAGLHFRQASFSFRTSDLPVLEHLL